MLANATDRLRAEDNASSRHRALRPGTRRRPAPTRVAITAVAAIIADQEFQRNMGTASTVRYDVRRDRLSVACDSAPSVSRT